MYVIAMTQDEHTAFHSKNPPKWKGDDMVVSPGLKAMSLTDREFIGFALEDDEEFGEGWTLEYDAVSRADWPEAFARGVERCIADLRKA